MPAPIIIKTPKRLVNKTKSEHDEQAEFVAWFKKLYPTVRIFAIPNGANLSGDDDDPNVIRTGDREKDKKLKAIKDNATRSKQWRYLVAEGASKGHPDLQIPAWRIAIEFKKGKGGVVSPEQEDWLRYYRSIGWDAVVCHGSDQAKDFINSFVRRV